MIMSATTRRDGHAKNNVHSFDYMAGPGIGCDERWWRSGWSRGCAMRNFLLHARRNGILRSVPANSCRPLGRVLSPFCRVQQDRGRTTTTVTKARCPDRRQFVFHAEEGEGTVDTKPVCRPSHARRPTAANPEEGVCSSTPVRNAPAP